MATDSHPVELQAAEHRRGFFVLIGLAVLTVAEFLVAIWLDDAVQLTLLGISAVLKAVLIAHYFMHWQQVWQHVGDIAAGDAEVVEE